MNKKGLLMVASMVLSVLFIAGCNQNDQDPPPENNNGVNENEGINENNGQTDQNNNQEPNVNEQENLLKDDNYNLEQQRMEPVEDGDDTGKKVIPLG
ncbi:hypothetical protein [Niallia sp. Krafla_26]|uniref:hypothetical protein n=1 Tax=Niallia sp. Krafla_26 TaxID=3064703 RepID=UPI003D164C2F